jgi:O-antigen/teichoic acid export membrane protein
MSRTNRFLSGLSISLMTTILTSIFGLWLTPFLISHLGTEIMGLWLIVFQVLQYLGLLDLGIMGLLPREVALSSAAQNDEKKIHNTLSAAWSAALFQWPIVILIASLIYFFIPSGWFLAQNALGGALCVFVLLFPLRIFNAILIGLQDFIYTGTVSLCAWCLQALLSVLLTLQGFALWAPVIAWMVFQIFITISAIIRIKRRHQTLFNFIYTTPKTSYLLKDFYLRGFWISLSQIAQSLLQGSETLLIGKFIGPTQVSVYSCTEKSISILRNQPVSIITTALPGLSQQREQEGILRASETSTALSLAVLIFSGFLTIGVASFNMSFVRWWVGSDFFIGHLTSLGIACSMLFRHLQAVCAMELYCYRDDKWISLTCLLSGLIAVVIASLLLNFQQLEWIPLAYIFADLCVAIPIFIHRIAFHRKSSLRAIVSPFLRFFILWFFIFAAAAMCGIQEWWWYQGPWLALLGNAGVTFVCLMLYALAMWPLLQKSALGPKINSLIHSMTSKFFFKLH